MNAPAIHRRAVHLAQYIQHPRAVQSDNTTIARMDLRPPTIVFLARAARIVGAVCILIWLIDFGINLLSEPNTGTAQDLTGMLEPIIALYLVPGVILLVMGILVKMGRLWPTVVIFLIGVLSLFKLVLLLIPLQAPIFNTPLVCEIPARIACAFLCVPCAFAWEDLAELSRTRGRRRKFGRISTPASHFPPPSTWPAPRPPPPARSRPRQKIQPEDPPSSHTPWT